MNLTRLALKWRALKARSRAAGLIRPGVVVGLGPGTVSALAPIVHAVKGTVECRLMMTDPDRHLAGFARAGADARVLTRSAVLTAAGISACAWRSRPRDAIAGRLAGLRGESRAVG